MDLIYMETRKRQDLLSKLGAWRSWERVEGEGKQEGEQRKYIAQQKTIKKIRMDLKIILFANIEI